MIRDLLLKQALNLVLVGFASASAYFGASGVTRTLAEPFTAAPPPSSARAAPDTEPKSADAILKRNAFDSETGPLRAKAERQQFFGDPGILAEPSDPLRAPSCAGVAALIITESSDRLWSAAALRANHESEAHLRRVGDRVAGGEVTFIGFNPRESSPAVWLKQGSQLCQVLLFRDQPPIAQEPKLDKPIATATGVPASISSKIRRVSENEFDIERSALEQVLEQQSTLFRLLRVVPEAKDGKVVGVRLFGVRAETLAGMLGLENGDRLDSINGFELGSPQKALEAYARLTTASTLVLNLNRHGTQRTIRYNVE